MAAQSTTISQDSNPLMTTYLRYVREQTDGSLSILDPVSGRMTISLTQSTIHEFLHSCGDLIADGVIRQTIIGNAALLPLL